MNDIPAQAEFFALDALGLSPREQAERARRDEIWAEARFETAKVLPLPELDGEQLEALLEIKAFLAAGARQSFCLHGLAGTGKTTVLASVARERRNATLVAPTGKAASVLARKTGMPVLTVHRLLYTPKADEDGNLVGWDKRWKPGELAGKVALVDEASMIGIGLADDLLATGIGVVASGDPGQLPPVEEVPFFTRPDFVLRQIRRQEAGSAIIRQAHRVRSGLPYASDDAAFRVIDRRDAVAQIDWADIVLCWRNETRHRLNRFIRERRGYSYFAWPEPGEPLMCLENHASGMMNGEIFTVAACEPNGRGIKFCDGPKGWIEKPWFEWKAHGEKQPRRRATFTLGYAITVHKAQGSEWPNVLVLDEFPGADRARWLYTAITRASAGVCVVPQYVSAQG